LQGASESIPRFRVREKRWQNREKFLRGVYEKIRKKGTTSIFTGMHSSLTLYYPGEWRGFFT